MFVSRQKAGEARRATRETKICLMRSFSCFELCRPKLAAIFHFAFSWICVRYRNVNLDRHRDDYECFDYREAALDQN